MTLGSTSTAEKAESGGWGRSRGARGLAGTRGGTRLPRGTGRQERTASGVGEGRVSPARTAPRTCGQRTCGVIRTGFACSLAEHQSLQLLDPTMSGIPSTGDKN